jgi:hypothetical protein
MPVPYCRKAGYSYIDEFTVKVLYMVPILYERSCGFLAPVIQYSVYIGRRRCIEIRHAIRL